jgi:hypothetical protein
MTDDPSHFIARRHATIEAEHEQRAQWEDEIERMTELAMLAYELEKRTERDRAQRRKYWEAMVQKRTAAARLPGGLT